MCAPVFLPLTTYREFPAEEMARRAKSFCDEMLRRRTVGQFSSRAVSREVIEDCLCVARSAPSGANKQPWHFVVVGDAAVQETEYGAAAERRERLYRGRAPKEWLDALAPLGTDENKPYLETALISSSSLRSIFKVTTDGRKLKNYYVTGEKSMWVLPRACSFWPST